MGFPKKRGWLCLAQVEEQALEGLFLATENILRDSKKEISRVNSVYYCEGPGSTLGLRLAAAFVKTLRWCHAHASFEVFAYNALDLASLLVSSKNSLIQAPFRVGFRFVRIPNSNPLEAEKKIIPQDEAFSEYPNSFHLPDIRKRSIPVSPEKTLSYDLSKEKIGFNNVRSNDDSSEAINRMFSPEFRNRIDSIIHFNHLSKDVVLSIVDKFIIEIEAQLEDKGVSLSINKDAKEYLAEEGYDEVYGARELGRIIQDKVKKPMAEELIFGKLSKGGHVEISLKENKIIFDFSNKQEVKKELA